MPTLAEINRNPLNIRPLPNGDVWKGQTGVSTNKTSGSFCVFSSNEYGVRAAVINLRSYVRAGVRTLRQAIERWAPPSDNNHTEAYIARVTQVSGVSADYSLAWLDNPKSAGSSARRVDLARIIRAMNLVEAGEATIDYMTAQAGIELALGRIELPEGTVRQDDGNVVIADMKDSTIMRDSGRGGVVQAGQTAAGVAAAAAPFLVPGLDFRVAIAIGAVVIILAGMSLYYFLKVRTARVAMHENGVA